MLRKYLRIAAAVVSAILLVVVFILGRNYVLWPPAESVTIHNDGVDLAGTLLLPGGSGRSPAVVLLHGSGPETRSEIAARSTAQALRRVGFAVLLFDKRGSGDSGGGTDYTFHDLTADALAAVDFLAGRDDILSDKIGVFANSQSGWLAPEVAVKSSHVAFVIGRVSSPLSWIETVLFEGGNDFRSEGMPDAEVRAVLQYFERLWTYYIAAAADPTLAEGPARTALEGERTALIEALGRERADVVGQIRPYDATTYRGLSIDLDYDPRPWLEQLEKPILYLFAEDDINVPTGAAVAYLSQLRTAGGKTNIEFVVLPNVGHSMTAASGLWNAGYVGQYIDTIQQWAVAQIQE